MMGFVIQKILRSEANPVEPGSCPGKPPDPTTTHGVFQPPFFFQGAMFILDILRGEVSSICTQNHQPTQRKNVENTMVVLCVCVFLCDISSPRAEKKTNAGTGGLGAYSYSHYWRQV